MSYPATIIKRDGREVPFDVERIRSSIRKAMVAKGVYSPDALSKVVGDVTATIGEVFRDKTPTVEEVQDIIEVSLMKNRMFEVAKAYILYRSKKTEIREEKKKVLGKSELDEIDKKFSVNALRLLAARYLVKDEKGIPTETPAQLFQRVAVAMALPEVFYDPRVFSKEAKYEVRREDADIELGAYSSKLDNYDCKYSLNGWPINKWHFERMIALYSELAAEGRMRVPFKRLLEMLEAREFRKAEEVAQQVFDLMVNKDFMPNTPTLVNAGRRLGMLSACFTLDVEDNMESIMKLAHDCAMVHKSGGGTGMNFSKLRQEGDVVASTTGVASGPISFMKMIDAVADVIKQGGVRRAANMGILEVWHPDIERFITSKQKDGVLENFNISVGINADFWEYFEKGEDYPLRHPKTGKVVRTVDPRKLFNLIAYNAWATADPGVLFFDNTNRRNVMRSFRGDVKVTNPCGEEPLYPYESCNLASINAGNFVVKGKDGKYVFDWERFDKVVRFVARTLDNVISINKYPLEEIDRTTKKTRRIGVGLMGVANALFMLKIRYNSEQGFAFMKRLAEHLTYYSYEESVQVASERGTFPLYEMTDYTKGELPIEGYYRREEWTLDWDALVIKIKENGLRNAMVTTAPPTGSIGMIADASTGIEPVFSLAFEKRVSVGSFYYTNEIFEEELKKRNLYSNDLVKSIVENYGSVQGLPDDAVPREIKDVFVTAMDIHWADHIMAQAVMQLWVTDSISKTINMPSDITVEDVEQAYLMAHELGCKGITIYRDESKSKQVLNINADVKEKKFKAEVSAYTLSAIERLVSEKAYLRDYIKLPLPRAQAAMAAPATAAALGSAVGATLVQLSINGAGAETVVEADILPDQQKLEKAIAPLVKEAKKVRHNFESCPACESKNIHNESGCVACKECGWSACTIS
ncbi:MAG: adenosylcobalamin-dependent ribonucleoside-diphosphate reductase [Candidatus Micrarchaeia archaeon]